MSVALSGDLHRGPDTHTNRPAATAVGVGTLYECTTHNLIYRSNGSTWVTYAAVVPPGGTSNQALTKNSSTDYDLSWQTPSGGGSSALLGYVAYNPGTLAAYTTTSTTEADVDGTNLAVTFTAPSSGNVLIRLSALCGINGTAVNFFWGLRESTTLVGSSQVNGFASSSVNLFLSVPFVVTGLTPGSSHTYKWSWHVSATGSPTARMYAGTGAGQAVMEVQAL